MFSVWGREDIGGMLTVSQSLMDRFADYEAMEEYPDINCIAAGMRVYMVDKSIITPVAIEQLAVSGEAPQILGYDAKRKKIVPVTAVNTRLSGRDVDVVVLPLSNGEKIRCTADHKLLTIEGYKDAGDVKAGDYLVSMFAGFCADGQSVMIAPRAGQLEVTSDPVHDGQAKVYDITTSTNNFICEGAVVHNSAFRYFANDATQPSVKDGRTMWTQSEDGALKGIGDDLLHKILRVEDEIWSQAYGIAMMGNDYLELLVTENGVVGTNMLPVPTMRRVERLDGGLVGFVQDITGQFSANSHELRRMLSGQAEIPRSLALFEDWQVAHFRMRATRRRSPYGVSTAEGARWIWKRLTMLEDSVMIYKLTRSPARFVYKIDVTDVPADKVEGFLRQAKSDLKKQKMVNPRTGRLDMRYATLARDEDIFIGVRDGNDLAGVEVLAGPDYQCLTGSTRVPLLDGSSKTIKEMADDGGKYWVYSCTTGGEVVPGEARSARLSHERADIWEVGLDNGKIVSCTWNHPFLTRDGRWVLARDLKAGDSLMPLYRRVTSKADGDRLDGYEQVYDPTEDVYVYTHQRVYDAVHEDKGWIKGTVIHHENGKRDNRPNMLRRVTRSEHTKLHEESVKQLHTPEVAAKRRETLRSPAARKRLREQWAGNKDRQRRHRKRMKARMADPAEREKHGKIITEWNKSEDHKQRIRGRKNPRYRSVETVSDLSALIKSTGARTMRQLMRQAKLSQSVIKRVLGGAGITWRRFAEENIPDWAPRGRAAAPGNHKVSFVRRTGRQEPVYDLTVEGTECFALAAGVFVHNSMDDVEYFKRMLHGTLNVPREYLGQEGATPSKSILSNDDVRAARVTLNLQREIRLGWERIIRTHLAIRGVRNPWQPELTVEMTIPSGIWEMAAYETLNARADYASRIMQWVSTRWIQENILKLTAEDIEVIEKEQKRDAGEEQAGDVPSYAGGVGPPEEAPPEEGGEPQQQQQQPAGGEEEGKPKPKPKPEPEPKPKSPEEWKQYDRHRRLEERRYQESTQRHDEIVNKLGDIMQSNDRRDMAFASRERQRMGFFKDLKRIALREQNGRVSALPSGQGRRGRRQGP